ncbi:hypothetical protein AHF37_01508 [Paragonimus kellicotti]|nr:hypothetical protein AHF37_01508 [Paragonimus kellicotti]
MFQRDSKHLPNFHRGDVFLSSKSLCYLRSFVSSIPSLSMPPLIMVHLTLANMLLLVDSQFFDQFCPPPS